MTPQLQLPGPGGAAPQKQPEQWSARGYIRFGLFSVFLLVGGLGTWGATAKLAGAVVASGTLRVTAQQQVVQHPDGGVVGAIHVKDGDVVEGGAVLVTLDGTSLTAELAALEGQLFELMARRGRLMAEQAEADRILFDEELLAVAEIDPEVRVLVDGQQSLFTARIQTMQREMSVMGERQGQISEQITGTEAELEALQQQLDLIEEELVAALDLLAKGLIQKSRVLSLQREAARLKGEVGQMIAQNAQLKGQISEIEIEQLRMMDTRREEAITQLREIGYRELELKQNRIQLKEQLDRLDIRAPRAGVIYDSQVHALKAVIRPADPLMYVVPTDTGMTIEARVDTIDIDSVYIGQDTALRFSAFNSRTTPELKGHVVKMSADSFTDEATGQQFYKVEVALEEGELEKLEGLELVAGMPVETHIQTEERTPLNYMVRPLTDYLGRALKEQ
ncbi:MAG: HlyD family type I secretion periplasmic adaptor subunit [Pseudomonadota bacterium]